MKLIFAGTPKFALAPLAAIKGAGYEIAAVLTMPDKPQGRRGVITPPPVKVLAEELVLQPVKLKNEPELLRELGADLMVTCAYGQILTEEILNLFPKGVWNIHASLLPAYRGAAPIARAIMDGCRKTGVTIMKTELGIDTGDILCSAPVEISDSDTAETLSEKLSLVGAELIVRELKGIEEGTITLKKQGEGFVCKKVQRTEIDFSKPSREVACLIRGLSPNPGSFARIEGLEVNFFLAEEVGLTEAVPWGTVVTCDAKKGLIVACGEGAVRLTELQPAGGKRMRDTAFANGRHLKGERFEPVC